MTVPDQPRRIVDPTTGRPILLAPQRQQRPILTSAKRSDNSCPFCPGNEAQTPEELFAVREETTGAWSVRVFDNKYPACEHHEVIAEGNAHCEQAADLGAATWTRIVSVWQSRVRSIESRQGVHCAYLFKNVGSLAGASIAHSHSQILGLDSLPPRIELELQQAALLDACPWCSTIASADAERRTICASRSHLALAPEPTKMPYETWILPRDCDDEFTTTDAASLGEVLQCTFAAVRDHLGSPAWNLWLHRAPGKRLHWHFELQPRTGQLAGLELGGDMYINSVPARESAARLRGE